MSSDIQISSTTQNYHPIFNEALKEYKRKTGNDLTTHPLAEEIKACDSPDAILSVLQGKANELDQSGDERFTTWLTPTVNVLNALSATLGQGVGTVGPSMLPHQNSTYPYDDFQVFPPTKIIFSGISILLVVSFLLSPTGLARLTTAGGEGHSSEPQYAYRTLRKDERLLCAPQDLHRDPIDSGDDERDGKNHG